MAPPKRKFLVTPFSVREIGRPVRSWSKVARVPIEAIAPVAS
ncbi:MAG: hypothetical protein ACREI8_10970 [Myxococcota bacterium]